MSLELTSSKRPLDCNPLEPNGKGLQPQHQLLKIPPGTTVFRVLCPASKTAGVIGKGGTVVRIEEIVPGCDERVIVISEPDKETEAGNEQSKEQDDNNEDKESAPGEDLQSDKTNSAMQKALFLVFEGMFEGEPGTDGGDEESKKFSSVVVRLLVLSSQVGCLLGKGGSVVKQMSAESGAQIRILPRDKLPSCATPPLMNLSR
uniref:K Homology domain-containing protein n=1 Tax=Nelumbo nucifera TaxID=4432 RepID=A0A822Y934_NELNU|nr:TPA_asm: hypothetical protein HUJ06_029267 [Nelumbo nucifera]